MTLSPVPSANSRTRQVLVAILLALSAVNLALMIPGGFVETRDFSAYPPLVLAAFNIFLAVLGLGALVLAWRTLRSGIRTAWSWAAAFGFAGVYLFDLFKIFPVTPVPMSEPLAALEWIGTALACLLGAALVGTRTAVARGPAKRQPIGQVLLLTTAGIAIVAFATQSAMGG